MLTSWSDAVSGPDATVQTESEHFQCLEARTEDKSKDIHKLCGERPCGGWTEVLNFHSPFLLVSQLSYCGSLPLKNPTGEEEEINTNKIEHIVTARGVTL